MKGEIETRWRAPVSFEGVSIQVAMVKITKDKP